MTKIKKTSADKDVGRGEPHFLLGLKTGTAIVEVMVENPQKAKTDLPYDTAMPLFGICPKDSTQYSTDICLTMVIAALVTIASKFTLVLIIQNRFQMVKLLGHSILVSKLSE